MGYVPTATGKSLYVVTEIVPLNGPSPIAAYDIGADGTLTFQVKYGVTFEGGGAVGLAVDSDSQSLFVTYEYTNKIRVIDATTMKERTVALAQDANDLAGIVYDHDKGLLYCIDRSTPRLYAYKWNANTNVLNTVKDSPFELSGAIGYGIALDEIEDELYVAGGGKDIRVYSTSNWSLLRTISLHRIAIGIAVDPKRGYLYTGGGYLGNYYLAQYNLADGTETEVQVATDAGVMGVAVDPATGYVYCTTGLDNRNGDNNDDRNDLMVYDSHMTLVQIVEHIGLDPTAVIIPGKQTSYNPLQLVKVIEESSANPSGVAEAPIGGQVTYDICFEHEDYTLSSVVITDTLPAEVTFVAADGEGQFGSYDKASHTYTWYDPPLDSGEQTCLSLIVEVNAGTAAGASITNSVTIDTAETPPTTASVEAVAVQVDESFAPLNVTKSILSGADTSDPSGTAYADAGAQITYRIYYDNKSNAKAVTNVTLVDTLPSTVSFVSVNDRVGQYDRATHTCTWTFASLEAGASGYVDLVVKINDAVTGGTVVVNRASLDSSETVSSSASVSLVAGYEPVQITKRIKNGATIDPNTPGRYLVDPGAELTYEICINNPSNTRTLAHLSIVDTLPQHTVFVSAEGDQQIGYYDDIVTPTYTWFYGTLTPGAQDCLDLVVRVDENAEPNTVISNSVTVSGSDTPSATAEVDVVVPAPSGTLVCNLLVKPAHLYRDQVAQQTSLMAVLHLPEGDGRSLIANKVAILTPGNIPAYTQRIFGNGKQGALMAFFDTRAFLAATAINDDLVVRVTGTLTDGRSFQGSQIITISQTNK